uniref:Titin n=1 Tax=Poecilia reticulata TaxID=8081 RepID=A0A3P9PW95_POERE
MTITWSAPETDGGTEIISYIVEKKDRAGIKWTRCNRQKITDLSYRVTGLTTGHEYEFRVSAENIVGPGEPSLPSSYYKASDPKYKPGAPAYVNVIDSTKSSIAVSWGKPLSDGGSTIQGYIVEVCKAEEEEWKMVTPPTGLRVNKYEIPKLTEGQEYKIQVCALNKMGVGEPVVLSGTAKPEERMDPPQIHLDSELRKGITVKAGGSVRIYVPFKGRPTPEIKWTKDDGDLSEKAVVEKAVNFTQLSIDSSDRHDSGKYTLTLTNSSGSVSEFVSVKVLDTPGAPQNLVVKDIKKDSVTLVWDAPAIDGDLKDGGEYQFRVCAINSEGVGEAANFHGTVLTSDRADPPEMELDADLRKVVSVRAGGTLRLFVPIRGRPEPSVKWEKLESTLTEHAAIDTTSSYTMLVIDNVNRFDSGKYSLTLENSSGTKSAVISVRILDTPSAPQNFTVKELKKDSVTLAWDTPLNDGGAKITNYIVEKRESVRKAYTTITSNCTASSFKIEDLPEGGIFYFRVCAVNAYGQGQAVETKETKVSEVPQPPNKVTLVDVTKTSASLAWEKPTHDGGSKIMCYNVEFKPKSGDKWGTACTVKVPEATVPNLNPNEAYLFRVLAINEKGKSEPKDLGLPVVAKDVAIEPSINLLFTTYSVKVGDDLTLEVPVRGRPKPVVSWKKDSLPLKQTSSITIINTATSSKIVIKGANREHVGKYEITLANTAGTVSASIGVVVLDKPGPPKGIKVDAVTSDSITLSWSPPEYDGGSPIAGYVIERREKTGMRWIRVNRDLVKDVTMVVTKLRKGCEYDFKVYAENAAGLSPASEPSATFRALDPLIVPCRPTKPKMINSTKDTVSILWRPPANDGGAPILGYSVEYREFIPRWVEAIPLTKSLEFTVTGLKTDVEYEFCVKAINKVGSSVRSPYSDPGAAADRTAEPSFDAAMEMRKVLIVKHGTSFTLSAPFKGKPAPTVQWSKEGVDLTVRGTIEATESSTSLTIEKSTRNDSGEYCVTIESPLGKATLPMVVKVLDSPGPPINGQTKWVKCATVRTLTHTIKSLREGAEYFFRVRAENHAGLSEPKEMIVPSCTVFFLTEAPEFDLKNYPKNTVYVKAGSDLTFEIPLTGKPMPKVTISKNNVVIKGSKRLLTEVTPDSLLITLNESISSDAGKYEVTASNAGGTTKISLIFIVLDKPGPPVGPVQIGEVGETTVCLKWDPPEYDGGSPVTNYVVMKRETSTPAWVEVSTNIARSAIKVTKLTKGEEYQFRIKAENRYGLSSHIDTKPVMIQLPYSKSLSQFDKDFLSGLMTHYFS